MAAEPASVQERWFARLYLLKPLVFAVFSLFWIATGVISLGPGWEVGMSLMREGGASETVGAFAVIAGALADIAIGLAIAYRPTDALRVVCRASHLIELRRHRNVACSTIMVRSARTDAEDLADHSPESYGARHP